MKTRYSSVISALFLLQGALFLTMGADTTPNGTLVVWGDYCLPYVAPGTGFRALSGGAFSSLALGNNGEVIGWGNNVYFTCTPPPATTGMMAIASGAFHCLALRSNGTIIAWGLNDSGQTGVPLGLNGVSAISAGGGHALALRTNGVVIGWGANNFGQRITPIGLTNARSISAGFYHSTALTSDGRIVAWGDNSRGQCDVPTGSNSYVAVSAGASHTAALTTEGTVVAWGSDDYGQITVPGNLTGVVSIAAGFNHNLALRADGFVIAWGNNESHQCDVPPELNSVVAVAAGANHSLALKSDGTIVGWPDNAPGRIPGTMKGIVAAAGSPWIITLNGDRSVSEPEPWRGSGISQAPAGSNFIEISGGAYGPAMALDKIGHVSIWRTNIWSTPPDLNSVVAISAGCLFSLALNTEGKVVAWGNNEVGQTDVPAWLSNVVTVAAGGVDGAGSSIFGHSLALRDDGTVVAWGYNNAGQLNVPVGLSNVAAIAAGGTHSLAVTDKGVVVGWGGNSYEQRNPPIGLTNVMAVAAGPRHSLALKSDGTIIVWGGLSGIPLKNVIAIAAFGTGGEDSRNFSIAVVREDGASGSPSILRHPVSRSVFVNAMVSLSVTAVGSPSVNYEWRRNGVRILGETNSTLKLNSVSAADSASYSVVVWNSAGLVESRDAYVAVLGDGANGNQPTPIMPSFPSASAGANSLVLVTHGWQWSVLNPSGPPAQPWMTDMTNAIRRYLLANGDSSDWQLESYYWLQQAWTFFPTTARSRAAKIGTLVGKRLASQGWERVHLISHSAGAALIQAITDELKRSPTPPIVQETFLDPFTGRFLEGRREYGKNADWADHYFVFSSDTDLLSPLITVAPSSTAGKIEWAHNIDVGGTLDAALEIPYVVDNGTAGSTPRVHIASHGTPIDFYISTINGKAAPCVSGYGFPLSVEAGGESRWGSHARNNPPYPLCGTVSFSQNEQPLRLDPMFNFTTLPSGSSRTELFDSGAFLTSTPPLQQDAKDDEFVLSKVAAEGPAWLALGVTITGFVNFVQFDARFTRTNASEGLLSVYWNTNELGTLDERVTEGEMQTYRFSLPGVVSNGVYTLGFRLDSFANETSAIAITNVSTGFVGLSERIKLDVSMDNGVPSLQLTATRNLTYLIQRSTNLVDWVPAALVLNTNGVARFVDSMAADATSVFYRGRLY